MQLLTTTMVGSAFYSKLNAGTSSYLFDDDKQDKPKPVFIAPGAGDKGRFGGADITFKLDKSQTSGNLGSSEIILQAGHLGAPPHHHKGFDEICIVQEGVVNILVGDEVFHLYGKTCLQQAGWHSWGTRICFHIGSFSMYINFGNVPVVETNFYGLRDFHFQG